MTKLINKNIELNSLLKEYNISIEHNSEYLENISKINVKDFNYTTVDGTISEYSPEFNSEEQYYDISNTFKSNSFIITELSYINEYNKYDISTNSYLLYFVSDDKLNLISYAIDFNNGFYYDQNNHIVTFEIDNDTIHDAYGQLYFDTQSIEYATKSNYGIGYVNIAYLDTKPNGVVTLNSNFAESIINYKYKFKSLYESLIGLYDQVSYVRTSYDDYMLNNIFGNYERKTTHIDSNTGDTITSKVTYINSYYFPELEIRYIDNYYVKNGMISSQLINQSFNLDDTKIIYCKDIESLEIYSYMNNRYYSDFQNNKEKFTNKNESIYENYSYVKYDYNNKYNKFLVRPYISKKNLKDKTINNTYDTLTVSKIKYVNRSADEKIFRRYGVILNSELYNKKLSYIYCLGIENSGKDISYIMNNIYYGFGDIQNDIKIIYDTRDISYVIYNEDPITINDNTSTYILITNNNSNNIQFSKIDLIGFNTLLEENIITKTDNSYLLYGIGYYNIYEDKYKKHIHPLYANLPTCYINYNALSNLKSYMINYGNLIRQMYCTEFSDIEYNDNELKKYYIYSISTSTNNKGKIKFSNLNYITYINI